MMTDEQEQHLMQLAAISTATVQNTPSSIFDRILRDNAYWTQAYGDTCVAVDREMKLIELLRWRTTSETPNPYQRIRIMWSYDNIAAGRKDLSDTIQNYTDDTGFARGDGYTAIAWQPLSDLPAYLIPA